MKLIQGFFYQYVRGLGLRYKDEEGLAATVEKGMFPFMYVGAFWLPRGGDPQLSWQGEMLDFFGQSRLEPMLVLDAELRFTKTYLKHDWHTNPELPIEFIFDEQEGNTWLGRYEIKGTQGPTRCIITDVDDALIQGDMKQFVKDNAQRYGISPTKIAEYLAR